MRLWHVDLIKHLPRQQLLGQHRECCALRGKGWGKNHSTVNYVFEHPYQMLYFYHLKVMKEMRKRNYNPDTIWYEICYRGKRLDIDKSILALNPDERLLLRYPEHDNIYLKECLENLEQKNVIINYEG